MTSTLPAFVDVVFPASVASVLTYRVPEAWRDLATPGKRVVAPLGRRTVTGYLVETRDRAPVTDTKELCEILDAEPLLDAHLLALTRWVADYYMCPWGEVIRTALPPGIDTLVRRVVRLTSAGQGALDGNSILRPGERDLLALVGTRVSVPIATLTRRWTNAPAQVHALARRGLLAVAADLRPARVRPLSVAYCVLAPGVDPDAAPLPSRAVKQRAILRSLAAAPDGLPRAEAGAGNPAALAALIRGGLVRVRDVEVTRDPLAATTEPRDAPKQLAPAQSEALQVIRQALAGRRFAPILLHGVTGSGKTEVYLQAIETALAQGQQALVLVPEISLTPLAVQRFLARFGGRVAVLHSGLRGGERFDAWRRIKGGGADIVVGARSAVFAPLPRLGILVVDEEHDPSYKQDEIPRYHGRDVAIMRAKALGAPVILGSATPSLESFERAQAGRYALVRLPERIEARPLPRVEIVDLRRVDGGERLLSPRSATPSRSGSPAASSRCSFSTGGASPRCCSVRSAAPPWIAPAVASRSPITPPAVGCVATPATSNGGRRRSARNATAPGCGTWDSGPSSSRPPCGSGSPRRAWTAWIETRPGTGAPPSGFSTA